MTTNLARQMPQDTSSDETALPALFQQKYAKYIQDIRAKNLDGILSLLTPDFAWIVEDGSSYNLDETKQLLQDQFQATASIEQMTITLLEVTTDQTSATVVLREEMQGVRNTESSRFASVETLRETWQMTQAGWQIQAATVLESHTLTLPLSPSPA